MIIDKLRKQGLIQPMPFMNEKTVAFLAMTGSTSYGVAMPSSSDMDVSGFAVPDKEDVFPHLRGEIVGFGNPKNRFETWQEHHIKANNKEYDFTIHSIVKFFHLVMGNNPNSLDVLFVPDNCVLHITPVGKIVRDNRRQFLHKGAWHKFKGFAYNNFHRYKQTDPSQAANEKRAATIAEHGYDTKGMYHVVRLFGEVEQILSEGDLDLLRNSDQLKSIRRGEWTLERLQAYFEEREITLEQLYQSSTLPHKPNEEALRQVLLQCLEEQYGSLDGAVSRGGTSAEAVLADLRRLMEKHGG
jgi:hypothetical protein